MRLASLLVSNNVFVGGPGFNNTTPKADYVSKFIEKGYTVSPTP